MQKAAKQNIFQFKLIVIGDSEVGKSSIAIRYRGENFQPNLMPTLGFDLFVKEIELDNKKIKMTIWDTAGQERFKHIAPMYQKNAMGVILTQSIANKESFFHIEDWMTQIKMYGNEKICKVLVGNKSDLERAIPTIEGKRLADNFGIKFFETSAKTGENIEQAFEELAKEIKEKVENEQIPYTILLDLPPGVPNKCCK